MTMQWRLLAALAALAGVAVALAHEHRGGAEPQTAGAQDSLLLRTLRFAERRLSNGMLRHVQSMARRRSGACSSWHARRRADALPR